MKQNLSELNYMRAFAAFMVIAIHIVSGRVNISILAFVWDVAMVCAVPVFIMLSGYLLHHSCKDKEPLIYGDFIRKRLSKVLIPYILWTIIYMIYSLGGDYKQIIKIEFVLKLLHNLVLGKGYVHLYFMVIIIQLYFVYPLLKNLFLKNPKLTLAISFAISFYFNLEPYLRQHSINLLPVAGRPYYFVFLARWLFYFVLGMYFSHNSQKLKAAVSSRKVELTILWTLLCTSIVLFSKAFGMSNQILNSVIFVYNVSSFLLLYAICLCFKGNSSAWTFFLEWFSRQSFIIYLSHLVLVKIVLLNITTVFGIYIWKGNVGLILLLLASVAITCIFAYIISLTPFAGMLGGVKKAKKVERVVNVSL